MSLIHKDDLAERAGITREQLDDLSRYVNLAAVPVEDMAQIHTNIRNMIEANKVTEAKRQAYHEKVEALTEGYINAVAAARPRGSRAAREAGGSPGLAADILELHVPAVSVEDDHSLECAGCDSGPYAEGDPSWPCRTINLLAKQFDDVREGIEKLDELEREHGGELDKLNKEMVTHWNSAVGRATI